MRPSGAAPKSRSSSPTGTLTGSSPCETDWDHLMKTMYFGHPQWDEFAERVRTALRYENDQWSCPGDMSTVTAVLTEMGMDVEKSLDLFRANGCRCDCEVVLDME